MPEETLKQVVDRVKATIPAIGNAITAKGGTVSSGDGLEDFAADIGTIPSGGGHTVKITTIANATVTLSNQTNTYMEVANSNGIATLEGVAVGTYTITATYDDATSDSTSITIADHTVTEDSFATLTLSASVNTTITVTDGTITKTLLYTGTPIIQYVSLGTWDVSASISGTTVTQTINVSTYTNENVYLVPPSAPISRVVDFVNNTTSITGDPSTHPIYTGMTRCNVADDGTINAYYGDAGYTEDGTNGQVMVYVPKFYYKLDVSDTGSLNDVNIRKGKWSIADSPLDDFKLHPAFLAADGVTELDYFLYGAFEAVGQDSNGTYSTSYNTTTYKLGSVGGNTYTPSTNFTRATARTMATNRGTGWYSAGVKQTMAILMLFAVEYGFNSQLAVGWGVVSDSAAHNTGQTTGNTTSGTRDNKTTSVNYRGIENLWGNIWNWVDGINYNKPSYDPLTYPYICNTFNFVDDTTTGYTQIGFRLPSTSSVGYITAFGYDAKNSWILLPSELSSTANVDGPIGDYFIIPISLGWRCAIFGGRWGTDSNAGALCWHCDTSSSHTDTGVGARLMYIPS